MSIYAKSKDLFESICAEVENNHQWSPYESGYDTPRKYCEYGGYERDAFDNWYDDYIKVNEKRPDIEDIMTAAKDIQMKRDSYLAWTD